jgi:hypothetical protein
MKRTYLKLLALLFVVGITSSCEKEYPEIETTSTYPVNGEWWVTYTQETSPGVFEDVGHGYSTLLTFNTSANNGDSLWVSDEGHFWNFKVKSAVNVPQRTFSVANKKSAALDKGQPYDIGVTISDGKVITGGGLSRTRVPTDSIYFRVEFEDDPGVIYHASGHRRTGFLEDEF